MTDNQPMYAKNQLQLVFWQSWTGLLKDWLQPVATSSVASCLKFGQKDWTGLDFKTLTPAACQHSAPFTSTSYSHQPPCQPFIIPMPVNSQHQPNCPQS